MPTSPPPDAQAGGEAEDFIRWYDETAPRVYGVVLAVVHDPDRAAAVTAQVYLDLWSGREAEDGTRTSMHGVVALAHVRAVDHVRVADPDGRPRHCRVAQPAGSALWRLPETDRRAVELAYYGGHSRVEIARLLDISPEATASLLTSGVVRLRAAR